MSEPTILETILAAKRDEVAAAQAQTSLADLRARAADCPPPRDFAGALRSAGEVRLIAEVKKASPSAGLIRPDFDPAAIAQAYAGGGASCLSVLTDARWFQGSPEYLRAAREASGLPALRKDFTVDAYQLWEARVMGADAVLLIVAALMPAELADLLGLAADLGLSALVEVHTAEETALAVEAGAELLGINNRNLHTFETTLRTTADLRPLVPAERLVISESGIRTPDGVRWLRAQGVGAMLVGESLMRQDDLEAATRALVDAGRGS
ncbi:MAG TPA: indole-3-glycerol phosphate synthase TrpC [Armatimonadetes bacterium]|nr:indole-3-glycerol phosphate synthase TrpC [Armatimonadota bacterium]